MHKITSLELLRTPILCLVQLSKNYENARPQMLKNIFSQSEKVAKCNLKSKAQVRVNVSF